MNKLTAEEIKNIESVQTLDEWDEVCDNIKKSRNGKYPDDWFERVLKSGLAERIMSRFGRKPVINFSSISFKKNKHL